jgi:hypothetical protein
MSVGVLRWRHRSQGLGLMDGCGVGGGKVRGTDSAALQECLFVPVGPIVLPYIDDW